MAGAVACVLAVAALALAQGSSEAGATVEAGRAGGQRPRFLVRFRDYEDAATLAARTLDRVAGPAADPGGEMRVDCADEACTGVNGTACRVVQRDNAAASFPTDFCVLECNGADADAAWLEKRLHSVVGFRDVHRDSHLAPSKAQRRLLAQLRAGPTSRAPQGLWAPSSITDTFKAEQLWAKGFTGKGIRVAVLDTGLMAGHPHFRRVEERTNWTAEDELKDTIGHGSFVAGVIASQHGACKGFAPDAELYLFRVFTSAQASFTSWFLDAFNYALFRGIDVLNLSIGGPDFFDQPFMDKVAEITSSGIIFVSAIGNDGPLYGTLMNPADQNDVIGVGGITASDTIAPFSSRGMTTWELPYGYGRVKPDIVTYAQDLRGSARSGRGCTSLSGTSVASPVVAGAVALLASTVPESRRAELVNPAVLKQVLVEGADRLPEAGHVYEQGAGRLNVLRSAELLAAYEPRPSFFPATLDLTDCPYMWPHCDQPLYAGAQPVTINVTILNGMGVSSYIVGPPRWVPGSEGERLQPSFSFEPQLWPWSGHLALHLRVPDAHAAWEGRAEGAIEVAIQAEARAGESEGRVATISLPVRANVVPTPPRHRRVLWDLFHNVRYPSPFVPRDNLDVLDDVLDWHADHPHTNFNGLWRALRKAGYFVEMLQGDFTCFDASRYGTLLLIDAEEEYFPAEVAKLAQDVATRGLGVVVMADWYDTEVMKRVRFFDDNTRCWWDPVTGGANVPALNDLLAPYGVALGDRVYSGPVIFGRHRFKFSSGTSVRSAPAGAELGLQTLRDLSTRVTRNKPRPPQRVPVLAAVGGEGLARRVTAWAALAASGAAPHSAATRSLLQNLRASAAPSQPPSAAPAGAVQGDGGERAGRIVVYGDSNCADTAQLDRDCYGFVDDLLAWAAGGEWKVGTPLARQDQAYTAPPMDTGVAERNPEAQLPLFSRVLAQGARPCSG